MTRFMVTFGAGQPNADRYMFVDADDETQARAQVARLYAHRWAYIYPPEDQAWVDMYPMMTELKFGRGIVETDVIRWAHTIDPELLK